MTPAIFTGEFFRFAAPGFHDHVEFAATHRRGVHDRVKVAGKCDVFIT
jgi:hypothetical protein